MEFVIIDNFVINLLLLVLVVRSVKLRSTKWRIVLSSLIGTVFALCLPFIMLPSLVLFCLKMLLGLLMIIIIARFRNTKEILLSFVFFISYTFLLGGACLGVLNLFGADVTSMLALSYSYQFPIGLLVFIIWLYVRIIFEFAKYINKKKHNNNFLYNIEIVSHFATVQVCAFLDSGNHLCDSSGLPVIVVNHKVFYKLFPKNCSSFSFLPFSTLSGENSKMIIAKPLHFFVYYDNYKIERNALVGLSILKIDFDALLHPAVV